MGGRGWEPSFEREQLRGQDEVLSSPHESGKLEGPRAVGLCWPEGAGGRVLPRRHAVTGVSLPPWFGPPPCWEVGTSWAKLKGWG